MTPVQFVMFVVIFIALEISMRFFCARVFKAWGKVIILLPSSYDSLEHYVVDSGGILSFTCLFDDASDFRSVRKARKAVRELEVDGFLDLRILEVYNVHKTGFRKSLPCFYARRRAARYTSPKTPPQAGIIRPRRRFAVYDLLSDKISAS